MNEVQNAGVARDGGKAPEIEVQSLNLVFPGPNPAKWKKNLANTEGRMCVRALAPLAPSGNPAAAAYAKIVNRNENLPQTPAGAGALAGKVPDGVTYWEWSDCTDPGNPGNPLNINNVLSIVPLPIGGEQKAVAVWFCATTNPALEAYYIEIKWFSLAAAASLTTDCC